MRWKIACVALLVGGCAAGVSSRQEHRDEFARIAQLEDARWDGDGELERLSEHLGAPVRERAATALGRLPFPEESAHVTRALLARLFDEDAAVRAAAAFALGVRGDASAGDKLVYAALDYHQSDADPLVRARAIEALSKLDRPEFHERILDALADPDPRVRLEAAQGASRWPTTAENASAINQRLVDHLKSEADVGVITYTLFALERRKAIEAVDAFKRRHDSGLEDVRLYANRGLRALAPDDRIVAPLIRSAQLDVRGVEAVDASQTGAVQLERDWRVRCAAAAGLAAVGGSVPLECVERLKHDPSPHVRRTAWEAIASTGASRWTEEQFNDLTEGAPLRLAVGMELRGERSASVRAAMLAALLPVSERSTEAFTAEQAAAAAPKLLANLERIASSENERIAIATALGEMQSPLAASMLSLLSDDSNVAVRGAAVEALAKHSDEATRARLHALLDDDDNGVRLAVVMAMRGKLAAGDDERLVRCFETTNGDGTPEVQCQVLEALAEFGGEHAKSLAARAMFDEHPFVRRTARKAFASLADDSAETRRALEASLAHRSEAEVDRRTQRIDVREHRSNPHVEVITTRGSMRFELFPHEAPLHVENFLSLIERGYYDGLTFHRVVPDFVIQGGCYRGDGNGGGTWRGPEESMRHEITPRKYVRGSLGMPRWDDVDSGGSQFFVTHRSTPHLDGRYTIFGELREGFDVLDAIEVGDEIVDIVISDH